MMFNSLLFTVSLDQFPPQDDLSAATTACCCALISARKVNMAVEHTTVIFLGVGINIRILMSCKTKFV